MSKVSLQELTDEAMSSSGLGKAWLQVVHAAVKSKVRRMPPRDFGFQEWDEATIEDVVQEVFVRRILNRGGKEYILAEASTTDHAHAGIYRLVPFMETCWKAGGTANPSFISRNKQWVCHNSSALLKNRGSAPLYGKIH